jgi:3-oxoadipate enol-lactonase
MKARIGDLTIGYSDHGRGLPVVFVHAFPLDRSMWARQEQDLSRNFRIITIDLRGHGESDMPSQPYSLDQAAADVEALLGFLHIERAILVGLSMGGYVLLALHRLSAHRIEGLVLADTKAQADSPEAKQGRLDMAKTASERGQAAIADLMIPRLLSPATINGKPEIVNTLRAMIERNPVAGITADLQAMSERADSMSLLPSITCPTQIIVGELDVATPLPDARLLADRIRHAELAVIPGAGHLSNLEQPEAFNRVVDSFACQIGKRIGI